MQGYIPSGKLFSKACRRSKTDAFHRLPRPVRRMLVGREIYGFASVYFETACYRMHLVDIKASGPKALDVLIVDDDAAMASELVDCLSRAGLSCADAPDAWGALKLISEGCRVSVVVSDLRMPELDGLQFADQLSRLTAQQKPEIVFVSGDAAYDDAVKAIRVGARDMLVKPVPPAALVRSVKSALLVRQMRKESGVAAEIPVAAKAPLARKRATLDSLRAVRKVRSKYFPSELFSDPCWEMLLDLYDSVLAEQPATVTSLSAASGASTTTAWRRISALETHGLIERLEDPDDKRRTIVRLSKAGLRAVENFFETYSSRQEA
jgi:CheY-like chemotaxis protein